MVKKTRLLLLTLALLLVSCSQEVAPQTITQDLLSTAPLSVYSWNGEYKDPNTIARLRSRGFQVDELYQGLSLFDLLISSSTPKAIEALKENGVTTSYLIGDPHWSKASTVITWALKPLVHYNKGGTDRITNVVVDIENYGNPEVYLTMLQGITSWCHENNLTVTACVPYWFVTSNPQICQCADALSVCVFSVGNEVAILEPVYRLAQEAHIPLEVVLDTQVPSVKYRVNEENTYFGHDLADLAQTIDRLETAYSGLKVSLHHLSAIL